MINNLHIKNIGIIDDLNLDLNNGLNVLTGETGAGKTLIIDSLKLLCGDRFSKDMIRKGEDHSFVEAFIEKENETIIVSRDIYSNGKNLCKINGRMVTVNELKSFMERVINIHGQHDNQNLLNNKSHIYYLDGYIGYKIKEIKDKYFELFEEYKKTKKELEENFGDDKEKQRKLDLLKYQLNEIETANLKAGEEEELESKRKIIANSEKINENLQIADIEISEHTIDSLDNAIRALEKIEDIDDKYQKTLNLLKNNYFDLQEIGRDINSYRDDVYFDDKEKYDIDTRLDTIYTLKRKYGNNTEEILEYKNELYEEINVIENLDEYIRSLKEKIVDLENKMKEYSSKMSEIRKKYSIKLSESINKELSDLEMENAKINITIEKDSDFNKNGLDKVIMLIRTNTGEDEKELSKIASGGEMSRIMLAIKKVLSETDIVPILVFDEIDTGISGMAANSVSEKLKSISKNHQVLCVTHLPIIAAKGDFNYYISKEIEDNKTNTKVKRLNADEKIEEIARIASGVITDISLKHAKELIYV